MKAKGITPVEIAIAAGVVILVGVLLFLAAGDQKRRARDTQRLEIVRSFQAELETFRLDRASYPAAIEDFPSAKGAGYGYAPTPTGCGENKPVLCTGYTLTFQLEGKIGGLSGGHCTVGPQGVTCAK